MRPARLLVIALVAQLLGGLGPSHVLCVHHDGQVAIERAASPTMRCDDGARRCVSAGLTARPDEEHCHDAAIAQPGVGQRQAMSAHGAHPVAFARGEPPTPLVPAAGVLRTPDRASFARARRSVVLRI